PAENVDPANLVSNRGMDDQGVGVGNPAALHRSVYGDGLWHTTDHPTEDPVVTFDLGQKYDLTDMVVWNEHQAGDRGVKDCTIEYSVDGIDYTALLDANSLELGNYTLTPYDDVNFSPPWAASDSIDLGTENVEARYVRMTIHSGWGDVPFGERNIVGLSEVRFYGEAMEMPLIPGDATGDNKVDDQDAKRLAKYWGATGPLDDLTMLQMGDFNGDGGIDARDAAILAAQWGYGVGSEASGTTVPEPSTGVALLLLVASLWFGRGRSRV
ncbi:MAG: PEP-CTERM sorting domain-containing protein, partial [Pirellulaceae bacterium]|nr:PEP-CTERM sorting domain-containing protein [Pirellulaceae bacterium]